MSLQTAAATPAAPTNAGTPDTDQTAEDNSWIKVLGLGFGIPVAIAFMLFAFLAPTTASGPHNLPIAISAPEPVATTMEETLDSQAPEAFEFQTKDSASEVQDAIMHRETVGGIVVDPTTQTTTIYTASGNGAPYATLLNTIAQGMQAQGQQVNVEELAPLSQNDPQGTSLSILGLPLAFGGMISAATLTLLLKNKPWHKLAGSLIISLVGGFVAAALIQYGYDLFPADTNYWSIAGTISLGIAAISLYVIGLAGLIGMPGVGIGAILTIFIANPLSGLATGWWWLPQPWGAIGQFLPIGATGHLLRSDLFFSGNGANQELWTLIAWVLVGVTLIAMPALRPKSQNVAA